jgi:hypothetical protein
MKAKNPMKQLIIWLGAAVLLGGGYPKCGAQEPSYQGRPLAEWLKALQSPDVNVRYWTVYAMGKIGPEAKPAVPVLAGLLRDDDRQVRRRVAIALARIGPRAKEAVPALLAMGDSSRPRRGTAGPDALPRGILASGFI